MAGEDAFYANPRTFMADNLVIVGGFAFPPERHPDSIFKFKIVEQADKNLANKKTKGGKVYILAPIANPGPGAQFIEAYYCPYEQNKSFFIMLGNKAQYMFTPQMDGCSFGVGSQGPGVPPRVGHTNLAGVGQDWQSVSLEEGRARQRGAQEAVLRNTLGAGASVIAPSDYMPNESEKATTFAERGNDGTWTFYTLAFSRVGQTKPTYIHLGITPR